MITRTVNDMYGVSVDNDTPLLSKYPATFWADYVANYKHYDLLFRRLYRSFKYFLQYDEDTLSDITKNFTDDVYNHLLINDKKYSELYRVNMVDDEKYHILDNYDITETMAKKTTGDTTLNTGARTDTNTSDYTQGSQSNTTTSGVEGFNSTSFQNSDEEKQSIGQRNDTSTNTINLGAQTNTSNENGTEDYTLTRKGNIGVQTATDILQRHYEFWKPYEFYTMIFGDIAKELLIV